MLEDRKVTAPRRRRAIQVTARIVAATNRDLEREVEAGRFRQDLYYRLNVHTLRVLLRDRLSDIPALVDHLLRTIARTLGMRPKTIARAVALLGARLAEEQRPGAAQLPGTDDDGVRRAAIGAADVPPEIRGEERDETADLSAPPGTLKALKAQAERQIVLGMRSRRTTGTSRARRRLSAFRIIPACSRSCAVTG